MGPLINDRSVTWREEFQPVTSESFSFLSKEEERMFRSSRKSTQVNRVETRIHPHRTSTSPEGQRNHQLRSHNGNQLLPSPTDIVKLSLTKSKGKKDFGLVLGCRIYIKEITDRSLIGKDGPSSVHEGDVLLKINNINLDNMTLKEVKKLIDSSKDKLNITVKRDVISAVMFHNNNHLQNNRNRHDSRYSIYENGGTGTSTLTKNPSLHGFVDPKFWTNQNVYVQPPSRSNNLSAPSPHHPQMNGHLHKNGVNLSRQPSNARPQPPPPPPPHAIHHQLPLPPYVSTNRGILINRDIELSAQPHLLPPRPTLPPPGMPANDVMMNFSSGVSRSQRHPGVGSSGMTSTISTEPRAISFRKEGSVGIRLMGGNEVGLFVTSVQPNSPAAIQGLSPGDKILKVNNTDLEGKTREEAVMLLLSAQDKVDLVVQHKKSEYENIMQSSKGDSFHVRTHFDYNSTTKGELSFHANEVFHVTDTLFNGSVGSWLVHRLGRNNQEVQKGTIPNQTRADQLASEQNAEKTRKLEASEGRGSFFRRRSARRSKSFSKDSRRHSTYESESIYSELCLSSKYPAYEKVSLKHPGFIRPLVIFGPLADIAREKLLREYPDKYATPMTEADEPNSSGGNVLDEASSSAKNSPVKSQGIFRLSSIREIIEKGKHPLLDVTPSSVERLNYAQFYPIVIFMRAESKTIVKELRVRHSKTGSRQKSSRKLFEKNVKLEKHWHHVFTSTIALTGADMWYKKLRETIERQQQQTIWLSDNKLDEIISDDFLFPMTSRPLSYASSPESDLDVSSTLNETKGLLDDDDDEDKKDVHRLVKASSDPSIATLDSTAQAASNVSSRPPSSHRQELSRALKRDSKVESGKGLHNQRSHQETQPPPPPNEDDREMDGLLARNITNNDLDAEEYYGTPAKDFAGLFPLSEPHHYSGGMTTSSRTDSPVRTPSQSLDKGSSSIATRGSTPGNSSPSKMSLVTNSTTTLTATSIPGTSLMSSSTTSSSNSRTPACPPRVDRGKKPERFKSAHERLFGNGLGKDKTTGRQENLSFSSSDSPPETKRDSMASPEYMNSSSFSLPPTTTSTTSTPNGIGSSSFLYSSPSKKPTTTGVSHSSGGSTDTSSIPYMRTKYQSFLSDLIRTTKDPPPPPPKPSNYQPIYMHHSTTSTSSSRLSISNRLCPPPPPPPPPTTSADPTSLSSSIFPPPPPPGTPPTTKMLAHVSPLYASASSWKDPPPPPPPVNASVPLELNGHHGHRSGGEGTYSSTGRTPRMPPPSAQELLAANTNSRSRGGAGMDSDAEVTEILSRKTYDIRSSGQQSSYPLYS